MDILDRFFAKVDMRSWGSCWMWRGYVTANGCGLCYVQRRNTYAHRFAYEQGVGPIPEGLQIDHLCRVRSCVNPLHLEPVTSRENTLRGNHPIAEQVKRTHCPRGHAYSGDNLYMYKNMRFCRICRRASVKASKKKRKEAQ